MWWKCQSMSFIVNYFSDVGRYERNVFMCDLYSSNLCKSQRHWYIVFWINFLKRKVFKKWPHIPVVAFNQKVCDNQLAGVVHCTTKLLFCNVCQCIFSSLLFTQTRQSLTKFSLSPIFSQGSKYSPSARFLTNLKEKPTIRPQDFFVVTSGESRCAHKQRQITSKLEKVCQHWIHMSCLFLKVGSEYMTQSQML